MLYCETTQQSEEMIKVLHPSDNADNQDDIPVAVIYGTSGSGKTRTAFDVAKNRYTLFFQNKRLSNDLEHAISKINSASYNRHYLSQDTFETTSKGILQHLILSRVLTEGGQRFVWPQAYSCYRYSSLFI